MTIFVLKDGNRLGPFAVEQVATAIRKGEMTMKDLVWHEGLSEWQPIHKLTEILNAVLPPIPGSGLANTETAPAAQQPPIPPLPILAPPVLPKENLESNKAAATECITPASLKGDQPTSRVEAAKAQFSIPPKTLLGVFLFGFVLAGLTTYRIYEATLFSLGVGLILAVGIVGLCGYGEMMQPPESKNTRTATVKNHVLVRIFGVVMILGGLVFFSGPFIAYQSFVKQSAVESQSTAVDHPPILGLNQNDAQYFQQSQASHSPSSWKLFLLASGASLAAGFGAIKVGIKSVMEFREVPAES